MSPNAFKNTTLVPAFGKSKNETKKLKSSLAACSLERPEEEAAIAPTAVTTLSWQSDLSSLEAAVRAVSKWPSTSLEVISSF